MFGIDGTGGILRDRLPRHAGNLRAAEKKQGAVRRFQDLRTTRHKRTHMDKLTPQ